MAVKRVQSSLDVVEAARMRIKNVFANGLPVYMSFSGGKDSICMADVVYQLIRRGEIDAKQLTVIFIDEEAVYDCVIEITKAWRKKFLLVGAQFRWYCLPLKQVSCFNQLTNDESWITWEPDKVWVRDPPPFAIRQSPFLPGVGSMNYQSFLPYIVSQELNQAQTQTLVDYIYEQVLVICGMPTTTKGGASTSDTGAAVFLRDGWSQCEARAKDTELLFEESERSFLRLTLSMIRTVVKDFNLNLREVDYKFTRRQHDNLLTKTQSLMQMLEAGLAPEVAIATSGLFNDPMDVAEQSKAFLRKWDYKEPVPAGSVPPSKGEPPKKVETEE